MADLDQAPPVEEPVPTVDPATLSVPDFAETPLQTKRPASPRLMGIVLLLFALFGLLGIILCMTLLVQGPTDHKRLLYVELLTVMLVGAPLAATMGIGLLRFAPWARKGTIISALAYLVFGAALGALVVSQVNNNKVAFMIAYAFVVFVGILIGGMMIYFLSRPRVVDAFKKG